MLTKLTELKEKFSKSLKVAHYTLLALGAYKTFEIVQSALKVF